MGDRERAAAFGRPSRRRDLAERVFVHISRNGCGFCGTHTTKVAAFDARTGAHQWTWDSNTQGHAFDLRGGAQRWVANVPTSNHDLGHFVLADTVIVTDPPAGAIHGFARNGGQLAWTRTVTGNELPAAPMRDCGCVLDGDVLLLGFANGELRPIDGNGTVGATMLQVQPNPAGVIAVHDMLLVASGGQMRGYKSIAIEAQAPFRIGTTVDVAVASPHDGGRAYLMPFALGTTPWSLPDGRSVPLTPDGLFWLSLDPSNPVFAGTVGTLDANGRTTVRVWLPPIPELDQLALHTLLLTLDGADVKTVSQPVTYTLRLNP